MPTALEDLFHQSRKNNQAVLLGYIPAGFPTQKKAKKIIKAMIDGGIDAIEIGYPYSDPVMDGPVIQSASEEAINNGAGVDEVFELLQMSVELGIPSVVMSYWSPIEKYGVSKFASE
ncbi:MAG: tryptophan synthase subunit alpha, partial [Actinobacteria bacterium]|nr:tryptophan synthase subunit alpha [Actinomycetota bacterium]